MRFYLLNFLLISSLLSCSLVDTSKPLNRNVASYKATIQDLSTVQFKVDQLTENIFHAYLLAQVSLQRFDEQLAKNPAEAMLDHSYSELLATRILVEEFEEQINELYVGLVLVSALPEYSAEEKEFAEKSLFRIVRFMEGFRKNDQALPDNLKPMILSNLREKQVTVFQELKSISTDSSVIKKNNQTTLKIIHHNSLLLRATRKPYVQDLGKYEIGKDVLVSTIQAESQDQDFLNLKTQIQTLSKEMNFFVKDIKAGSSSTGDSIIPSAGSNGNISGNAYPANTWSLTFDDGPVGKTTAQVVQHLVNKDMRATFFLLAKQVQAFPDTAQSISDTPGMDVASHSYDHAQLTKVGPIALEKQIGTAKSILENKLGKPIQLFRLPYGAGVSMAAIRKKIAEHKLIHVFWNVDTLDWQDKNPESIFKRAVRQMKGNSKNAGIILFHDIHPQSVIASAKLMDYLKEVKVNVCTVQEVVDQINQGLPDCKKTP